MKKTSFLVLGCLLLFVACKESKGTYVINGVTPENNFDGEFVYLFSYDSGEIMDSVAVSDGKFTFEGVPESIIPARVVLKRKSASLILEEGVISINLSEEFSAKGTPLTDKLNKYLSEKKSLMTQARGQFSEIDLSLSDSEKKEAQEKIINDFATRLAELSESYLTEHPNDALGAMVFNGWMQGQNTPSEELFEEASKKVGENVLNFGPVKELSEYFANLRKTAEGQPFTDFTIENGNMDGSPASLSDYVGKGKYVLVDFWASWCNPCLKEIPVISEIYEEYKGDNFEVLSVAIWDKREKTLSAIEEKNLAWPQIVDAEKIPSEIYGIKGIPHIILFAPDGTIVARNLRGHAMKEKIAEVLKK